MIYETIRCMTAITEKLSKHASITYRSLKSLYCISTFVVILDDMSTMAYRLTAPPNQQHARKRCAPLPNTKHWLTRNLRKPPKYYSCLFLFSADYVCQRQLNDIPSAETKIINGLGQIAQAHKYPVKGLGISLMTEYTRRAASRHSAFLAAFDWHR